MSPSPCVRGEGTQIETPLRQPLDTIAARSFGVNGISVTPSILTHPHRPHRSILIRSCRVPPKAVYRGTPETCRTLLGSGRRWLTRSDAHTSELQSLMRISYAVLCLKNT